MCPRSMSHLEKVQHRAQEKTVGNLRSDTAGESITVMNMMLNGLDSRAGNMSPGSLMKIEILKSRYGRRSEIWHDSQALGKCQGPHSESSHCKQLGIAENFT